MERGTSDWRTAKGTCKATIPCVCGRGDASSWSRLGSQPTYSRFRRTQDSLRGGVKARVPLPACRSSTSLTLPAPGSGEGVKR